MTTLQAVILAVIQGATEFLPVSSSGHTVLVQSVMGITAEGVVWEVALHLGTLAVVLWMFRTDVIQIVVGFLKGIRESFRRGFRAAWGENPHYRMGWYLVLGTIPAGLVGIFLKDQIEALFDNPLISAGMIFVTGEILWLTRPHSLVPQGHDVNLRDSIWIGLAQSVAIIPGISRSGSTIAAGLMRDVKRDAAARFSFLLAIPAILGAAVLELGDFGKLTGPELKTMGIGVAVSAVTGYIALSVLLRVVKRGRLHLFAWYCWGISLVSLAWFWRQAVMFN